MRYLLALLFIVCSVSARAGSITVAAAISMKDALGEIAQVYKTETGEEVKFTFGSSGQLMAQIKNGAPIDVFISAASKQVDDLAKEKLIDEASRRVVVGNLLVLIVPAKAESAPASFAELADAKVKKIAMGEPKTVPAGQYASQTLTSQKVLDKLTGRIVYGANVRQVLDYVERGEVDAGIVYLTDAKESGDKVKVVATADAASHEPIVYPGVVVTGTRQAELSKKFLDYLSSDKAKAILSAKGFALPEARGK